MLWSDNFIIESWQNTVKYLSKVYNLFNIWKGLQLNVVFHNQFQKNIKICLTFFTLKYLVLMNYFVIYCLNIMLLMIWWILLCVGLKTFNTFQAYEICENMFIPLAINMTIQYKKKQWGTCNSWEGTTHYRKLLLYVF